MAITSSPATQPPHKGKVRVPALHPLRSRAEIHAAPATGEWELSPTGSTPGSRCPKEGNAKHKSPASPRAAMLLSLAPSGTKKQTRRCRKGGQGTLRIWGIFSLPVLKIPCPILQQPYESWAHCHKEGGIDLFQNWVWREKWS